MVKTSLLFSRAVTHFIYSVVIQPICSFSLRGIRAKVWKGRTESPLFDCKQYCTAIEKLFKSMWERHNRGEKPDHLTELTSPEVRRDIEISKMAKLTCSNNKMSPEHEVSNYKSNHEESPSNILVAAE